MKYTIPSLLAFGAVTASLHASAIALHEYNFNNDLKDSIGSVDLTGNGGSLASFGSYTFGANQGLTFLGESSLGPDYSIAMRFSLDFTTGFRKLVDYKDLTSDAGFYVYENSLNFYPHTGGGSVSPATAMDVVITRDGTSGLVNGYLNGIPAFLFTDTSGDADGTFSGNSLFKFFIDDLATSQGEASSGSVDKIVIYQGVLSAGEIAGTVPDGGATAGLLSLGLLGMGILRRKTQKA